MPRGLDFLLISLGGTGDTYPVLATAIALQNRGHRVRFAGNARFAPLAEAACLNFAGYRGSTSSSDAQMLSLRKRRTRGALRYSWLYQSLSRNGRRKRSYLGAARWVYDLIASQSNPAGTIVIARANSLGARIAQEKLGIPLVTVQLQPAAFRSIYDAPGLPLPGFAGNTIRKLTWSLIDAGLGATITPALNQFRSELGLARVRRPLRRWLYSSDLVIGLFPEWFGPPQRDWPPNTHAVGFPFFDETGFRPIPDGLNRFISHGDPPIVFTRGSHGCSPEAYTFFKTSIEIVRTLKRRAIFLVREGDWVPEALPDNIGCFGYIPLKHVLPRSAAIVHHGGIGTTAHAFAAGIPQIAVPLYDDQPDNAARIERLGGGFRISLREYSTKLAANKLHFLLHSDQAHSICRELAAKVAGQDSLSEACRLIEDWAIRRVPDQIRAL